MKKLFLVVGMAGSGKTTFCQRLYTWLSSKSCTIDLETSCNKDICSINLDPAVINPKMPLTIDIRDYYELSEIMEKYEIGPNGACITCLNLFFLKIPDFIDKLNSKYIIIDTPGQLEIIWSASTNYIFNIFKKLEYEINVLYCCDSILSLKPIVFLNNMLFAINLKSKYDERIVMLWNKVDDGDFEKLNWMTDFIALKNDIENEIETGSLLNSVILYFEHVYSKFESISVSGLNDNGKFNFMQLFQIK